MCADVVMRLANMDCSLKSQRFSYGRNISICWACMCSLRMQLTLDKGHVFTPGGVYVWYGPPER